MQEETVGFEGMDDKLLFARGFAPGPHQKPSKKHIFINGILFFLKVLGEGSEGPSFKKVPPVVLLQITIYLAAKLFPPRGLQIENSVL